MQYAPIGVFVLISIVFAQQGAKALGPLLVVTLTVYLGLIVHLVVTYGGFLAVFKLGLVKFLKGANEAMITAFVTRSSSGTLPITLRVAEENMGIPRSISSFTLPLGATINMDGTAIYLGVCAMFIGYAIGKPLTFNQQLTVIITATLASIGTAGVPGAGAIMLLMVLESDRPQGRGGQRRRGRLRHDPGHRRPAGHGPHLPQRHRRHGRNRHRVQDRGRAGHVQVVQGLSA